jgi:predicted sulfurtransferase
VGGSIDDCHQHIAQVEQHPVLQGSDIDFKLAESGGTPNDMCRMESGFSRLTVREVEELVTLGPQASGRAKLKNVGKHLTPVEFHALLVQAQEGTCHRHSSSTTCSCDQVQPGPVLIDARNVYESNIGRFQVVRGSHVCAGGQAVLIK